VRAAKSPDEAAEQLRKCGYATDVSYPDKLMRIIDANDLTGGSIARPSVITPADSRRSRVMPEARPSPRPPRPARRQLGLWWWLALLPQTVRAAFGALADLDRASWRSWPGAAVFAAIHWRK
jgi:hypothetical protein